jgi:hypothetical protein
MVTRRHQTCTRVKSLCVAKHSLGGAISRGTCGSTPASVPSFVITMDVENRSFRFVSTGLHALHISAYEHSDLHYTFINGYIPARNRILANIQGVENPLGTLAVSHGTAERIQENDPTSAKIQSARKHSRVARRSLNICELTIQHGNQILTCGYPS